MLHTRPLRVVTNSLPSVLPRRWQIEGGRGAVSAVQRDSCDGQPASLLALLPERRRHHPIPRCDARWTMCDVLRMVTCGVRGVVHNGSRTRSSSPMPLARAATCLHNAQCTIGGISLVLSPTVSRSNCLVPCLAHHAFRILVDSDCEVFFDIRTWAELCGEEIQQQPERRFRVGECYRTSFRNGCMERLYGTARFGGWGKKPPASQP